MPTESIRAIRALMLRALDLRGIHGHDGMLVVADFMSAELEGHVRDGIRRFIEIDAELAARIGSPDVVAQGESYALVDAHRELGPIAARFCTDFLSCLVKRRGLFLIALINSTPCYHLKPHGKILANQGFVSVSVSRTGTWSAELGAGGSGTSVCGNRMCVSFPTKTSPLILDFRALPFAGMREDSACGRLEEITPTELGMARGLGRAFCLVVEVLAGGLITARMARLAASEYDLGCLFLAINPPIFRPLQDFQADLETLLESNWMDYSAAWRSTIPDDSETMGLEKEGMISIDDHTYERLLSMAL